MTQEGGFILIFQIRRWRSYKLSNFAKSHIPSKCWNPGLKLQTCARSTALCVLWFTSYLPVRLWAPGAQEPQSNNHFIPSTQHRACTYQSPENADRMLFVQSPVLWCAFKEGRNLDPDILRSL